MWQRAKRFLAEDWLYYSHSLGKKPLTTQMREMYSLYRYYGFVPYQYLKHGLFLKSFKGDIYDYVPPELIHRLQRRLNPASHVENVTDKEKFAQIMKDGNFPTVNELFTIKPGPLIQDDNGRNVSFREFVDQLRDIESTNTFVMKPIFGYQGHGIIKVSIQDSELFVEKKIVGESRLHELLFRENNFTRYLLQPLIVQHGLLNRINPSSVNTVRIDTFVIGNEVVNNGAVLRVGNSGMFMDNWAMGGLVVPIDLETGKLGEIGKTKSKFGRKVFDKHPTTGFRFSGTQLPFWTELRELVRAAALRMLPLKLLGWDVAITNDGPLFIETNQDYDVFLLQEGVGGLRGTPIVQNLQL